MMQRLKLPPITEDRMARKDLIKYSKHWRHTMSPEECSADSNMAAKL